MGPRRRRLPLANGWLVPRRPGRLRRSAGGPAATPLRTCAGLSRRVHLAARLLGMAPQPLRVDPGNLDRRTSGYVYAQPRWVQREGRWFFEQPRWTARNGRDRDHDGVPDRFEHGRDRDRDGIPDRYEHGRRDQDRDGIPNRRDYDRDGDGVPNNRDSRPDNPRRN